MRFGARISRHPTPCVPMPRCPDTPATRRTDTRTTCVSASGYPDTPRSCVRCPVFRTPDNPRLEHSDIPHPTICYFFLPHAKFPFPLRDKGSALSLIPPPRSFDRFAPNIRVHRLPVRLALGGQRPYTHSPPPPQETLPLQETAAAVRQKSSRLPLANKMPVFRTCAPATKTESSICRTPHLHIIDLYFPR